MLNWIWLGMLLLATIVGGLNGKLPEVTKGAFDAAEMAVMKIALPLLGVWAVWLGIMRLAERAGLVQMLARVLRPLMRRLFPDVPADHPAQGAMVMNMASNMLGLGNAATPLGLRAMKLLSSLNGRPGVATNSMVTFLALNTASIQLIPTTAISVLVINGATEAYRIVPSAFLATLIAATSGVLMAKLLQNLPMFRFETYEPDAPAGNASDTPAEEVVSEKLELPPVSVAGKVTLALYLATFAWLFLLLAFPNSWPGWAAAEAMKSRLTPHVAMNILNAIALLAIPFMLSFFPLYAALRGVKVYEQFVEGAREAWETTRRTIPYLVAMLVAIAMLRAAGVIEIITQRLKGVFDAIHFPSELLPMVLMRPLSGSATNGLFNELVKTAHEPDGLLSRMAATIYGSTETTFYVLAVYFGSVAIRKTRHAVVVGLTADLVAVIASVAICHLLFG